VTDREPGLEDATRRTYLAQERTLLAWWRSGMAAIAVAVAVGRLVPDLLQVSPEPFVALGIGFAALGIGFFAVGSVRDRAVRRDLERGGFRPLSGAAVWGLATLMIVLALATLALLLVEA
jgi:uncharacterized membrane protein YidH (DUF202 family)